MGTTGLTAQARGRNEAEQVVLTLLRNGVLALALGIIILILQQPIREIGFTLLRAEPEVIEAGQIYNGSEISKT